MTRKEKYSIANANGNGKSFLDSEIGKEVLKEIAPSEESARVRKVILAILEALKVANISVDETKIAEFLEHSNRVEETKKAVKDECGVEVPKVVATTSKRKTSRSKTTK